MRALRNLLAPTVVLSTAVVPTAVLAIFFGGGCESNPPSLAKDKAASSHSGSASSFAAASSGPAPIPAPSDVAWPPADAEKSPTGLVTKVLQPGTGTEHPGPKDTVKLHYTGWTTDGKMFDSSVARNRPITFGLSNVIPGWKEGLQMMVVGEKRRMWIPEELAYKNRKGAPEGTLVLDVELLDIIPAPKPIPAPPDVSAAPADAIKTKSGLASKVLQPGTGTVHPQASSEVRVDYTGWTTDGNMFDSSITRGVPATFSLSGVIAGWTEGLQLMVEGEKRRFWIPQDLAYKGRPGAPAGMLVFDVELQKILPPRAPAASFSTKAGSFTIRPNAGTEWSSSSSSPVSSASH